MFLQHPIPPRTRVVILTRFSKEEQRRQSTTDQFDFCNEFVREHCAAPDSVHHIKDEGISGEVRDRPGIEELRAMIMARQVDLILCEDSSRLYRNTSLCLELVGLAVDKQIRVICRNDNVDTCNEDWPTVLTAAQMHHSQDNQYTRHRIKRSHDGLFKSGAAIGILRPGYLREPRVPADPKSPKFDKVDPVWIETIQEAFQRVADGQRLEEVAAFLTRVGLPKASNSHLPDWTETTVISLIRCSKYRGFESFRSTISTKVHTSGKSHSVRNSDPKKILTREIPHLRIVDDPLWYAANKTIDDRGGGRDRPSGIDHSLYGIPRDSRGPLSTVFVCGICGAKMHMEGRNEGGYRCSAARKGKCWNKSTALRDLTHEKIGGAVSAAILEASAAIVPDLLQYVADRLADRDDLRRQQTEFQKRLQALKVVEDRLIRAISQSDDPPASLIEALKHNESESTELLSEIQSLEYRLRAECTLPSPSELLAHVQEVAAHLSLDDPAAGSLLRTLLVGPIRAIPCQQFGSSKVVLRAEMTLNLVELLPDHLRTQVRDRLPIQGTPNLLLRQITVDLFKPSKAPRYALQALELYQPNSDIHPTLKVMAAELGISERVTDLALQLGKALHAAGRTDPFQPLTECPANPGRWRFRKAE